MDSENKDSSTEPTKKDVNIYGLQRAIPADVKREVRKNAGFGCIICGRAITQYEHVDPEWHDAKIHDPAKMAALCGYDHDKVSRGYLSKDTVKHWMANPKAKARRYSESELDLLTKNLTIILGGNTYIDVSTPIGISGKPLFTVKAPLDTSSEFLLSATFYDSTGKETLKIVDNKCTFPADNWDVDFVGGKFEIRDQNKKICLRLITNPPHTIIIDKIDMTMNGWTLIGDSKKVTITNLEGGGSVTTEGNFIYGTTLPGKFHINLSDKDDWGRRMMQRHKDRPYL